MSDQWVTGIFPTVKDGPDALRQIAAKDLRHIACDIRRLGNHYRSNPERMIEERETIEAKIINIARMLEAQ